MDISKANTGNREESRTFQNELLCLCCCQARNMHFYINNVYYCMQYMWVTQLY